MTGKEIKQHLKNGGSVFGMFFHYITNPAIVEVLPDQGLDFVIVNVEHNALDLARVHSREPDDVTRVCDSFRDGVVVPYAEDPVQVRRLLAAAKYAR